MKNPNLEDITDAEMEAWFAERLQTESDATREEEAGERFWIGLGILVVIFGGLIAANEWLRTLGYGA